MNRKPQPILVAIAGGSGSGKSWLAGRLAKALGRGVSRISLDDFYHDLSHLPAKSRERVNFDHPHAIDWPCLERVLEDCRSGRRTRLPRYDFKTHCRRPGLTGWWPRPVVICDGLWLLRRPALRRLFDLGVFLECSARLRLARRMARDIRERGRSRASVARQFKDHVAPMHRRFVASQARRADVVLRSPVSARDVRRLAEALQKLRAGRKGGA